MTIFRIVFFNLLSFATLFASAQTPTDFRSEQIYLAPKTLTCNPGDSLIVNGIVTCLAADRTEPYSRYLNLELIGENDSVYVRQKLSCADGGRFSTAIQTEPDFPKGIYYLRGYTRYMRNFSPLGYALQPVGIGIPMPEMDLTVDEDIDCKLSTSGGYLLPDKPQRLTAVLTNYAGFPLADRSLWLIDNNNDTILTSITSQSGYASFDFIPNGKRSYSIVFDNDGINKIFKAPEVNAGAIKIKGAINGSRLLYELSDGASKIKNLRLYLYDRNNGISEISNPGKSGLVNLNNAPTGPVTIFASDPTLQVITQTTVLPRHVLSGKLNAPLSVEPGSEIKYDITGIDTTGCSIIARVMPDNIHWFSDATESLQFSSDFESELPFPKEQHAKGDLAAWLETARFVRFNLREAVENDSSFYKFMPEFNMELSGEVFDDVKGMHHLSDGRLVAFNGSTNAVSDTTVTDGRFRMAVDDFADGDVFFLQASKKNGLVGSKVVLDDESFPAVMIERRIQSEHNRYAKSSTSIGEFTGSIFELPDVTVKARVVHQSEVSAKAHYEVKMKDRETIDRRGYVTLLDILRDMPLITIRKKANGDGGGNGMTNMTQWELLSNRGPSTLKNDNGMALIVDGSRVDNEQFDLMLGMSAKDIESVEQVGIGEAMAYAPFTIYGAILVKTRNWKPDKPIKSKGSIVCPIGLSNIKNNTTTEIFAPDRNGHYRLVVDIIGKNGVHSYTAPFKVNGSKDF